MTELNKAVAISGIVAFVVGLVLAAGAASTGTVDVWLESILVLVSIGALFAGSARAFASSRSASMAR